MADARDLVVLVAPSGLADGVRDALQDWSAVGLVSPFGWLDDLESVVARRPRVSVVDDGAAREVNLSQVLTDQEFRRIRVCVLVPAFADEPVVATTVEDSLAQLIRTTAGSAEITLIRMILTRPGCGPGAAPAAREGWHNLVLSPEDARGPRTAHLVLPPTTDPLEIGAHAAAAVSGVTGLWAGVDQTPLDTVRVPDGEYARVVRCFFRRVDASELGTALRRGVLSMEAELPRPRVGVNRAVAVEDVELATSTMARNLWTKHADVLKGHRVPITAVAAEKIGFRAALSMLFGFLAAAIKGAPTAWYQSMVGGVTSAVATRVQTAVFGTAPSAYEVVVRGRGPSGRAADWTDLRQASADLSEVIGPVGERTQIAHVDLSRVWRDYTSATLTLLDAGERVPQLRPVAVGADRGVITSVRDVVPAPTEAFVVSGGTLGQQVGTDRLEAADVLGVDSARRRLAALGTDQVLALEASRLQGAIEAWAGPLRRSFAVQSGAVLARAVTTLADEVRQLLSALTGAAGDTSISDEIRRRQRRLATVLRVVAVVAVLLVIATLVLGGLAVIAWTTAAIIGGAVLLGWFLTSFIAFVQGQRDLFAELNRREQAATAAETNRVNLAYAAADLRRVTDAYAQHLTWSRVLGTFTRTPFGVLPEQTEREALTNDGLPLAMALATARPDPKELATTVALLRREYFRDGWLSEPFSLLLREAPEALGVDGLDLADDPEQLYGARGTGDSLLVRWASVLGLDGVGSAGAVAAWKRISRALRGNPTVDGLLQQVSPFGTGAPVTRTSFMNEVATERRPGDDLLDQDIFTAPARSRQDNAVAVPWTATAHADLDEVAVRVELSVATSPYDLIGLEPRTTPPPDPTPGPSNVF